MKQLEWIATAAFGLEGLVAQELRRLGLEAKGETGGAHFTATPEQAFRANLHLRCADRVLLVVGSFPATSFDMLFEGVRALPWERFLPRDAAFPVRGKCARSGLKSVSDCQAITKKAMATRLGKSYGLSRLPETGAVYTVDVSLHEDRALLTLDSSGTALNRRGYRTWNGEAPLRETLAAAMVRLSPWRPGLPLHDPLCGTGTLLIEAGMDAARIPPGLHRSFACESWSFFDPENCVAQRAEAQAGIALSRAEDLTGGDRDEEALELARRHLQQAGLSGRVGLALEEVRQVNRPQGRGVFLCNPPYGQRLSTGEDLTPLYKDLRALALRHPGWALCLITADKGFERAYGRRADKRRRLYNGRLECELLTFLPKGW